MTRSLKLSVTATALLVVACQGTPPDSAAVPDGAGRVFRSASWDTVLRVGMTNPDDTTLLSPSRLRVGPEQIYIIDNIHQNIRALDAKTGRLDWSFANAGQGPRQLGNAMDVQVLPDGTIWLLDSGNGKFLIFDNDGRLLRTRSLPPELSRPGRFVISGDRLYLFSQYVAEAYAILRLSDFDVLSVGHLPWPDGMTQDLNLKISTAVARDSGGSVWLAAYEYGPGFLISRESEVRPFEYFDPKTFPLKSGPSVRAAGADSAEYAARAASIVGDSVFILFGGRPRRQAHLAQDTRFIDCYSVVDGSYQFSLYLPGDTRSMDTVDALTFHVLTEVDGLPLLLGLRPTLSSGNLVLK